jgi:hypothetical protein
MVFTVGMKTMVAVNLLGKVIMRVMKTNVAVILLGNGHHGSNEDYHGRNFTWKWLS